MKFYFFIKNFRNWYNFSMKINPSNLFFQNIKCENIVSILIAIFVCVLFDTVIIFFYWSNVLNLKKTKNEK